MGLAKSPDDPIAPWRKKWGSLMGGEASDGAMCCNHGCECIALEPGHVVSKFVDTFFDVLLIHKVREEVGGQGEISKPKGYKMSKSVVNYALRATYDCYEEVWLYKKLRDVAIQILVKMGTNAILAGLDMDLAHAITHLECFHATDRLPFGSMTKDTVMKFFKLGDGGEREVIRFFAKRISCNCLKEKYSEVKAQQAKTGICSYCRETKDRSALHFCASCNVCSYCSRQCQASDWPDHKASCKMWSGGNEKELCVVTVPTLAGVYSPKG